jgi:hypothetical protein
MTRYTPLWQQGGSYSAALDRALVTALWPTSQAAVPLPTVVANTMNLSIAPGTAAVALQAGAGSALCTWDAAETVTVAAAPPSGQSRTDLVVLQVRDPQLDSGVNNDFVFQVIAGTPATPGPGAAPAVPTNAMAICTVIVAGNVANLNGATITDARVGLSHPVNVLGYGELTANSGSFAQTPAASTLVYNVTIPGSVGRRAKVSTLTMIQATAGTSGNAHAAIYVGGTKMVEALGPLTSGGWMSLFCERVITLGPGNSSVQLYVWVDGGLTAANIFASTSQPTTMTVLDVGGA